MSAVAVAVVAAALITTTGPVAEARVEPRLSEDALAQAAAPLTAATLALRGRPATEDEIGWWGVSIFWGWGIDALARPIANDEGRARAAVTTLYQDTLGRAPEPSGLAYWTTRFVGEQPIFRLEAGFWASPELYQRAGGTDAAYVDALYEGIIGRPADDPGREYWVGRLAAGVRRSTVALRFLNTPEVRGVKADGVFQELFDRPATPAERAEWGPLLVTLGDTARLVASTLYRDHVTTPTQGPRCGTVLPGTARATGGDLTADGDQVVFASNTQGLVPEDTDALSDVFLHDRTAGTTTLLSIGPGAADQPSIGADGAFVTWRRASESAADQHDIDVWERATGLVTRATTGIADDSTPVISADGRYLAHTATIADPDPPEGFPASISDVIVTDRTTSTTTVLPEVAVRESDPHISPDGRFVAYTSATKVPVASIPRPQYVATSAVLWDRTTGTSVVAPQGDIQIAQATSVADDGSAIGIALVDPFDDGGIFLAGSWTVGQTGVAAETGNEGVVLSGDGSVLVFGSTDAGLAPGGLPTGPDLYARAEGSSAFVRLSDEVPGLAVLATSADASAVLYRAEVPDLGSRALLVCDWVGSGST